MSYTKNQFPQQYIPTEFDNYHTKLMVDGKEVELDLVDTSGKDEDKLRALSFNKCDIFMLLFAINQRDSFINCKVKWLKDIMEDYKKEDGDVPKFVLIGTKCDTKSATSSVKQTDIDKFVNENEGCIEYKETSAMTQDGVKEAFEVAVRAVLYPKNRGNSGCSCVIL